MDRNYDAPSRQFALNLLRKHPQITYEHAVSAAEHSGVATLSQGVFESAAAHLGIVRDREERLAGTSPPAGIPAAGMLTGDAARPEAPGEPSNLLRQLDEFRAGMRETATIRAGLLRMRQVVRAALADS